MGATERIEQILKTELETPLNRKAVDVAGKTIKAENLLPLCSASSDSEKCFL